MKLILRGIIDTAYREDGFTGIDLIQEDGYKADLILRIKEFVNNYGTKVTIRYWLADKRDSDEKIMTKTIKKLLGFVEANYEKEDYQYSEYTSGTDYNTIFNISGHNLYAEIVDAKGKYLILEIEKAKKSN